uniref:NADAR domain-containing protein n=1 Tax=Panagrolaimus superbus TaxID=310955 RepID=A0A914YQA4_9BILA
MSLDISSISRKSDGKESIEEGEIKDEKEGQRLRRQKQRLDSISEDEKDKVKEKSPIKDRENKDKREERPRKRRYSSNSEDEKDNAKRTRRSEPSRSRVERPKLVAGEYPSHEIPSKWNLSFEPEELTEVEPRKKLNSKRKTLSPQPIPITESSEAESSSNSPVKKVKMESVIGNFWRVKPPFPRAKTIIAKDGTCLSLFFTNKYVFSNHFPADFTVNGINYSCSEQYYMRFKAVYFGDNEIAEYIMQTSDPKEMKRYGRQVEDFDEEKWKKVSLQVR